LNNTVIYKKQSLPDQKKQKIFFTWRKTESSLPSLVKALAVCLSPKVLAVRLSPKVLVRVRPRFLPSVFRHLPLPLSVKVLSKMLAVRSEPLF